MRAPHHYKATLGPDPAEIEGPRSAVTTMAAEAGFADRADDVALALDEIVANAQEHGRPPVVVDVWTDGRLVVEVRDQGGGFDYGGICRSHPPEPYGRRGRGLWIVRQLVDTVSIRCSPDGTYVHIELTQEPQIGA